MHVQNGLKMAKNAKNGIFGVATLATELEKIKSRLVARVKSRLPNLKKFIKYVEKIDEVLIFWPKLSTKGPKFQSRLVACNCAT